jgi:hypothetical protein
MRFMGLAFISAASGAMWGCENARPPSPGTSEAPSSSTSSTANLGPGAETAPAAVPGAARVSETAPRVTRVALQGSDTPGGNPQQKLLAAGDPPLTGERLLRDPLIGDTLIGDGEPMDDVDDAASGVAEPDRGDDPAGGDPTGSDPTGSGPRGLAKPDPDQAGAPVEPPSFPRPALSPGASPEGSMGLRAGQAAARATALENQQR